MVVVHTAPKCMRCDMMVDFRLCVGFGYVYNYRETHSKLCIPKPNTIAHGHTFGCFKCMVVIQITLKCMSGVHNVSFMLCVDFGYAYFMENAIVRYVYGNV